MEEVLLLAEMKTKYNQELVLNSDPLTNKNFEIISR